MGIGFTDKELYATNVGRENGEIFLSKWKPVLVDGEYHWPPNTPIGNDMWAPNVLGLKPEDGVVKVEIVPSDTETGLWYVCCDGDFLGEKWLYSFKPKLKTKNGYHGFDSEYAREVISEPDDIFGLHVWTDNIEMKSGDGPIPVTLKKVF
jgi:hypothetical protein